MLAALQADRVFVQRGGPNHWDLVGQTAKKHRSKSQPPPCRRGEKDQGNVGLGHTFRHEYRGWLEEIEPGHLAASRCHQNAPGQEARSEAHAHWGFCQGLQGSALKLKGVQEGDGQQRRASEEGERGACQEEVLLLLLLIGARC